MRASTIVAVAAATLSSASLPAELRAQTDQARAAAISAVLQFRPAYLDRETRFDACQIYELLGRPDGFPSQLSGSAPAALTTDTPPCAVRSDPASPHAVVDSVSVGVEGLVVYVTVLRGHYVHQENYTIKEHRPGQAEVISVHVWGPAHVRPRPGE